MESELLLLLCMYDFSYFMFFVVYVYFPCLVFVPGLHSFDYRYNIGSLDYSFNERLFKRNVFFSFLRGKQGAVPFFGENENISKLQNDLETIEKHIEKQLYNNFKLKFKLNAIQVRDYNGMLRIFYQNQYHHTLKRRAKPFEIGVFN